MAAKIEPFYGVVGRRLQQLRTAAGLTQEQLGNLLVPTMTRASIANIETGKQRLLAKTLVDLAAALKRDVHDLLPPSTKAVRPKAVDIRAELAKALPPDAEIEKLAASIRRGKEDT